MNSPDSSRQIFNRAFKVWRKKNGYGVIDDRKDARVILSHLMWMMEHEREVSSFLLGMTEGDRLGLNHPTSIYRAYHRHEEALKRLAEQQAREAAGEGDEPPTPPPPPPPPGSWGDKLENSADFAAHAFFEAHGRGARADDVLRSILKMRRRYRHVPKQQEGGWADDPLVGGD